MKRPIHRRETHKSVEGLRLSNIVENVSLREKVEKLLNRHYHGDTLSRRDLMWLESCNECMPNIVQIPHTGTLKILAFSDYRIHEIEELFHLLRRLNEKPDLIIYAGDDVDRFAPLPKELASFYFSDEELEVAGISDGRSVWTSAENGFALRLPAEGADESVARSRILKVMEFIERLYRKRSETKILQEDHLKELLSEYPTFQIRRNISELTQIHGDHIDVIDCNTGNIVLSFHESDSEGLNPCYRSWYFDLYLMIEKYGPSSINIKMIHKDGRFAYFYISWWKDNNLFEELASYAKYGLVAVIGNDDRSPDRLRIHGRNVYEAHNTWISLGPLLIIGVEGSTCGMGSSGNYSEGSVRLRLELARELSEVESKKLLIVSHSPPRGVLDRALRFGDEPIGSLALRDFLEEYDNVSLVICGHVHRCGGRHERVNSTVVVNAGSHDDPFSRANVAWITLNQDGHVEDVRWFKTPSLLETILTRYEGEERYRLLKEKAEFSDQEAVLFVSAYNRFGDKLFEDLDSLAHIKFNYGFTWDNMFRLYERGVTSVESIT